MAKGIKARKPRTCPICSTEYIPRSSLQKVCHNWKCAIAFNQQKEAEKLEKDERASLRKRKADLKPLKHWEDLTQRVVNDYITKGRDADKPCISCGTWETVQWEAGHYRSRGAASHLRYNEDNLAKQCHRCNCELSSNAIHYREGLVARIGLQRVEALENNNTPHRYTREELKALRTHFGALLRALKKQEEAA